MVVAQLVERSLPKPEIVWLISSLTRLDLTKQENKLLFVCTEAVESKLVKLETSCTVILPPTAIVFSDYPFGAVLLKWAIPASVFFIFVFSIFFLNNFSLNFCDFQQLS